MYSIINYRLSILVTSGPWGKKKKKKPNSRRIQFGENTTLLLSKPIL